MPKQFSGFGISFLYPDNWRVTEEGDPTNPGMGVTVESPGGAFLSIIRYVGVQESAEMIDSFRQTMEREYEEVETEEIDLAIQDWELSGISQSFYYLDLLITSKVLAANYLQDLFIIQIQGEDRELTQLDQVFQAILVSMLQSLNLTKS